MQYRRENRNKINFGFPLVYCANLTGWIICKVVSGIWFKMGKKTYIYKTIIRLCDCLLGEW